MLFALVGEVGPVRATTITYVNPAVAVIAGVLVLDEPFTVWTVVGFVLVVAGSFLVNRRPRTRRRRATLRGVRLSRWLSNRDRDVSGSTSIHTCSARPTRRLFSSYAAVRRPRFAADAST